MTRKAKQEIGERTPEELLRRVPLFAELHSDQIAELARRVRRHSFAPEEIIFRRGDPGDTLHVIVEGKVRVESPSDVGASVILRLLEPGEFFGELALCDGQPRSATVTAMEPTTTVALHRDDFMHCLYVSPQSACQILVVLAGRLRETSDRLCESIFYDTASRLARRLLQLAEREGEPVDGRPVTLKREVSPEELAELVGATAERIRVELESLEQDQIIDATDHHLTIRRPALLRERIHRKPTAGLGTVTIPTWLLE